MILKFKAYDIESQEFLKNESFLGHYDDLYFEDLNKIFADQDIAFLQFTGLTDRKGKEIYVNHIIQHARFGDWTDNHSMEEIEIKSIDEFFEQVGWKKRALGERWDPEFLEIVGFNAPEM